MTAALLPTCVSLGEMPDMSAFEDVVSAFERCEQQGCDGAKCCEAMAKRGDVDTCQPSEDLAPECLVCCRVLNGTVCTEPPSPSTRCPDAALMSCDRYRNFQESGYGYISRMGMGKSGQMGWNANETTLAGEVADMIRGLPQPPPTTAGDSLPLHYQNGYIEKVVGSVAEVYLNAQLEELRSAIMGTLSDEAKYYMLRNAQAVNSSTGAGGEERFTGSVWCIDEVCAFDEPPAASSMVTPSLMAPGGRSTPSNRQTWVASGVEVRDPGGSSIGAVKVGRKREPTPLLIPW